jgi:hypothetical protein
VDALGPLPSLSNLEAASDAGGVAAAAGLTIERKALDNQTQMMSQLLSSALPQPGAYLDLSPAAQASMLR